MIKMYNGDMVIATEVFGGVMGGVKFVFADPPYKITQARYDKNRFDYKVM